LTSELERIKILEGKISQIVDYINRLLSENEKLKGQLKETRAEKKGLEEMAKKAEKFDEILQNYKSEKEEIREKIESIIGQIDQIGL
jgi:FtsZ-binding cell division protein ZapB